MTLRQHATTLVVETPGRCLLEITARVADWVHSTSVRDGLLEADGARFTTPEQLMADFEADVMRWNDEHGRA